MQSGGNGSIYYRQPNWRGDVALSTNQSGGSVHQYFYSPYGRLLDNNSKLLDSSSFTGPHNRYTLSGKPLDAESGLTYFGARYYDAANGVWLTRDPVRGPLSDPTSRHAYLFNRANPVRFTDPFGAYTVQPGDTLWDIASQYSGSGTNWSALYAFNLNVVGGNPNLIYPGQDLYIPWGEDGSGWGRGGGGALNMVKPEPPPLDNAKALCASGTTGGWLPPGLISWCVSVAADNVVPPIPANFTEQIRAQIATWPAPPQPTDIGNLKQSLSDFIHSILSGYDVGVGFAKDQNGNALINLDNQLRALDTIWQAVDALAQAALSVLRPTLPLFMRPFAASEWAFRQLFGPTQIQVEATQSQVTTVAVTDKEGNIVQKPPYGINCGFETGSSTRCDPRTPGSWNIEVALNRLLGEGEPEKTGVNLMVHELAHTLTYQEYNFDVMKTELKFESLYNYWNENAGVRAASVTSADEFTADLIASWALNNWKKDNAINNTNLLDFGQNRNLQKG